MEISNPLPMDRMYTDDGHLVHCKLVAIPPWNMDTTAQSSVPHGLGALGLHIMMADAQVVNDAASVQCCIGYIADAVDPGFIAGGVAGWDTTNVYLRRRTGGFFDGAAWSGAVISRGWCYIWYYE
jgi:hypothetical protein